MLHLVCIALALLQLDPHRDWRAATESGPLAHVATSQCATVFESLWNAPHGEVRWSTEERAFRMPEIFAEHDATLTERMLAPRLLVVDDKVYTRLPHLWRFTAPGEYTRVHIAGLWRGATTATFNAIGAADSGWHLSGRSWGVSAWGSLNKPPRWQSAWEPLGDLPWSNRPDTFTLAISRDGYALDGTKTTARAFIPVPPEDVLDANGASFPIEFFFVRQNDGSLAASIKLVWPEDVFDAIVTVLDTRSDPPKQTRIIASRPYDVIERVFGELVSRRYDDFFRYTIPEIQNIPPDKLAGEVRWIRDPRAQRQ